MNVYESRKFASTFQVWFAPHLKLNADWYLFCKYDICKVNEHVFKSKHQNNLNGFPDFLQIKSTNFVLSYPDRERALARIHTVAILLPYFARVLRKRVLVISLHPSFQNSCVYFWINQVHADSLIIKKSINPFFLAFICKRCLSETLFSKEVIEQSRILKDIN